jgi:hypothetical protein
MLQSSIKEFKKYKLLGEKTFEQLSDAEMMQIQADHANSVAIIVQHLAGNMLSRWTNIFTEDGEKQWRNREAEFDSVEQSKDMIIDLMGIRLATALPDAGKSDRMKTCQKTIYIRNEPHTVEAAILRQLCHYAYHVGQMVHIGKCIKGAAWKSLSIPKGESEAFNTAKFKNPRS